MPFAIAEARVVSVTTFGTTPVKAVLHRTDGSIAARIGPRTDDWNIALSRPLPAGQYTLDLAAAAPPGTAATSSGPASNSGDDADAPDDDGQAPQTAASQAAEPPRDGDAPADTADSQSDDTPAPSVEIRLALPAALDPIAASAAIVALPGYGVHVLTLPQPAPGSLAVAQAQAAAAIVLTLERHDADGWRIVALDQGLAPIVAAPVDADAKPWRVQAWTVDGGPEPISLAARAVDGATQSPGRVSLTKLDDSLAMTRVHFAAPGIAAVAGAPAGVLAGGWPGHALTPVEGGTVLPEGPDIWFLARQPAAFDVTPETLPPGGTAALAIQAGLVTTLPALAAHAGHVALWRAESGLGLPGLGAGMGVAAGSTLALADGAVTLRNAVKDDALRLRLTRIEASLSPPRTLDAPLQTVIAPGTALPLILPAGDKQIRVDLAPGLAAIAGGSVVWTGGVSLSRSLAGSWTDIVLVNTGEAPAPASLSWQPAPPAETLHAGSIVKRFFGADGSFEIAAEMAPGAHLIAAGNATLTVITADGRVARGRDVTLTGRARVVVTTGMGAMAVWEASDGASPWPAVTPQAVQLPARMPMSGPAMALAVQQDGPVLLHARTTAPVLIGSVQSGRASTPELFPAGAEWHRMVAAGHAELRIYSPHDGPLSGTLDLSADSITPIAEGLGDAVSVAPGGTAVFGFQLAKAATVGLGVRATPDRVSVKLLDASGQSLGEGVAQLQKLPAGQYAIEAHIPPDAATTVLRPAIVGISPRGNGPPPEVVQSYLELAGMKPQGKTP